MSNDINEINSSFDKCVKKFNQLFETFDSKIQFLKLCEKDPFFIDKDTKYQAIKECIQVLVDNARETDSRKNQQKTLMPIIAKISQNLSDQDLNDYFLNDNFSFSLFCLMHITFIYEESISSHVNQHHKYIVEALNRSTKQLINFNEGK